MSLEVAEALGRRACEWIARHEADFFLVGHGESAEQNHAKYLAELALIAGTLIDEMPGARGLLARAWDGLGRGEHIARLLPTWPIAATSYVPFRLAGVRSLELERQLGERDWLAPHARFPPFAKFALGIALEGLGVPTPWDEAEVVLANRFFDRPVSGTPPIRAVFLAHAIMWRSEMGRDRAGLGAQAIELYRAVAPEWHRLLVESGHLDPLGEMIIADVCAGTEPPHASLAALAAAQRDDGAVPPRRDDTTSLFDDLYHTTCVAALAGTLAARSPRNVRATVHVPV
ncbi:MAG TPA: hypothetical protein VGG28_32910 [Kofleriaceae bacterium]|jgi:hypothetical protein